MCSLEAYLKPVGKDGEGTSASQDAGDGHLGQRGSELCG